MTEFSHVDEVLGSAIDRGDVPGVVAMAATRDGVVYQAAFGRQALSAQIVKGEVELTRSVLLNTGGYANASGLGQTFQPSRDVHPVTKDVVVLHNDVALVNAETELDAFLSGDPNIPLRHYVLNLGRTPQGVDDTGELDQQAVPGCFDDAASVFSNFRVDDLFPDRP